MSSKKPPEFADINARWPRLFDSFLDESDYIVAIVGAAFIDHLLYSILGMKLTDSGTAYGLLKDGGSLGNLVTRAKFAYSLGIISDGVRENIEHIAEIRNSFAHKLDALSFADKAIAKECEAIHLPSQTSVIGPVADGTDKFETFTRMVGRASKGSRDHFVHAVAAIATYLLYKYNRLGERPSTLKDDWDQSPAK